MFLIVVLVVHATQDIQKFVNDTWQKKLKVQGLDILKVELELTMQTYFSFWKLSRWWELCWHGKNNGMVQWNAKPWVEKFNIYTFQKLVVHNNHIIKLNLTFLVFPGITISKSFTLTMCNNCKIGQNSIKASWKTFLYFFSTFEQAIRQVNIF